MPIYNRRCPQCGNVREDCYEPINFAGVVQCSCGSNMLRAHITGKGGNVSQDSIEGGILIYNGICNPDGTPKRYYSKSEIAEAGRKAGLVNTGNKHVPMPGTDKAFEGATTRWDCISPISEEERLRHWHEHERQLQASR